ncbi:hypothetical protein IQ07DRAFT_30162 [Pyrenochaeta sp. DS3sAY3a]|nr:hypothetical protein IQ07DRAFT_30162 [Pyrenochaeta sp. DS3sAY3a]
MVIICQALPSDLKNNTNLNTIQNDMKTRPFSCRRAIVATRMIERKIEIEIESQRSCASVGCVLAQLLRPHSTTICSTWRAHSHGEVRQHVLRHAPLAERPEDPEKCIGTFTELAFARIDLQALWPPDEQKQKNLTRRTSCKQQQGLCRLTLSLAGV